MTTPDTHHETPPRETAAPRFEIVPTISTPLYDLYLGDAREVIPRLGFFDAVHTDPPYGLGDRLKGGSWGATTDRPVEWDYEARADFVMPLLEVAPIVIIWGGNYYELPPSRGWLSWFKPDAPPSMANFELAWTNQDRNARQMCYSIAATNAERCGHPSQKPVAVMGWAMDTMGVPPHGKVLDAFAGSGSIGVACIRSGRRYVGIEKDPAFFELMANRLCAEASHLSLFAEVSP